jgi:hypothetical protein
MIPANDWLIWATAACQPLHAWYNAATRRKAQDTSTERGRLNEAYAAQQLHLQQLWPPVASPARARTQVEELAWYPDYPRYPIPPEEQHAQMKRDAEQLMRDLGVIREDTPDA